jgi:hypothetical protein
MYGVMVVFRFHASPSPFPFALHPSKLVSALLLTCPNLPWGSLHNVCPFICQLCVLVSGVVWVWPVVGRAVPFRATGGVECA